MTVISPADLYRMQPEETTTYVSELFGCYYSHVPELRDIPDGNTRVEIRVIRHVDYDDRRYWRLATVWLDDRPVMVIQNAGREGDDHARRFVTDAVAYAEMVGYLASLAADGDGDMYDPDAPRDDLLTFYGDTMKIDPAITRKD